MGKRFDKKYIYDRLSVGRCTVNMDKFTRGHHKIIDYEKYFKFHYPSEYTTVKKCDRAVIHRPDKNCLNIDLVEFKGKEKGVAAKQLRASKDQVQGKLTAVASGKHPKFRLFWVSRQSPRRKPPILGITQHDKKYGRVRWLQCGTSLPSF